ncbi:sirohydrochlorin chelatase [Leptothrix discophora]|uniref:CbiX/SirB N-terminal domain-containing protein n=1 Tax=Leptothrix discophora TaxID=89 RepID=A0ABT9G275_LEPDI|nr:CbiX/SirB N-terminal domain-containing protein [Leptothrix discophora]MDP4300525.1 CbiX/SirB N-terminal domain-containing protein [Leptothrix discophora]
MQGILLFAHGARDPAWARPFEAIAAQMRAAAPQQAVALAFLELMQPGLKDAVATMRAQGCDDITVVPLFLGAGGHVRRDLPALIEELRAAHPGLALRTTPAIGETEVVTRAIALAALELATQDRPAP